jgi:hypothetical protein
MKKFRGKALATLLSLALIASSLPVTLASASSKTVQGRLTKDPDNDEFWLVNGGTSTEERQVENFESLLYDDDVIPLETIDREKVEDIEISSISHVSGDRVVKWDIKDDDDEDEDSDDNGINDVTLSLRNADSEGDEVIAILFKGTYTDDDDNEYTVKASTEVTIHAVDRYATVIGEADYSGDVGVESPELDDDFAVKTTSVDADGGMVYDSKTLVVYRAVPNTEEGKKALAKWEALNTVKDGDSTGNAYYTLTCNNKNIDLITTTSSAVTTTSSTVTATVNDTDTGNVTFTAKIIENNVNEGGTKDITTEDGKKKFAVADDYDEIKVKVKIAKKVLVNDNASSYTIKEDDNNYTVIVNDDDTDHPLKIDGGYEVEFDCTTPPSVTVTDDASVDSITGTVDELTVGDASVDEIDLDKGTVIIDDEDAKVGDIATEGDVDVSDVKITADVSVGNIDVDGTGTVTIEAGSAGDITTKGKVNIPASDDDTAVSVGTVSAKEITIDSEDGKISVKGIVSSKDADDTDETSITLSGDSVSVGSIDFDYYGTTLKFDDFQGEVPAPEHAYVDGSKIETNNEDDDVTIKGDVEIDTVSFEDESTIVFEDELNVDELDGSGTMYIGAGKLYVDDDASDVLVKITDTDLKKGDLVFTADSDAVDEDDLDFFGFTVEKEEGKTTDKFVVDELEFAGLALNKTSSKIVLGESETFTASAYAPGTSMPEGYGIAFELEDNGGVFELTDNGNGTATVTVVDYDETFSDENKATLRAYVVDEDGDEDDDYDAAECDLTALKTPEVTWTSDTTDDFTLAPGASYQFKITATEAPVMVAGTAGVLDVTNVGKSGNDYFIKVTAAANAAGKETGLYVNGTKLLVVKVAGAASFTSDTTADVTVKKGASYQYKITASAAPSFTLGTSGVFNYTLVSKSGNDYFYKITAVGAVGSSTGVYVNGQKVNVATVG